MSAKPYTKRKRKKEEDEEEKPRIHISFMPIKLFFLNHSTLLKSLIVAIRYVVKMFVCMCYLVGCLQ